MSFIHIVQIELEHLRSFVGWLFISLGLLTGCVRIDKDVRVEKGPTLRTFERERKVPAGLRGNLTLEGTTLTAQVVRQYVCQRETVEEFLENHVTERSSPGAGPTLSAGITTTLAGAILLATTPLFSPEPDRFISGGMERTGASPRQVATAWSIGSLVVGIPALAVGLIQWARTGQSTETVKAQGVVSLNEKRCEEAPAEGALVLLGSEGARWVGEAGEPGQAKWRAESWKGEAVDNVAIGEEIVELDEDGLQTLHSFFRGLASNRAPSEPAH